MVLQPLQPAGVCLSHEAADLLVAGPGGRDGDSDFQLPSESSPCFEQERRALERKMSEMEEEMKVQEARRRRAHSSARDGWGMG